MTRRIFATPTIFCFAILVTAAFAEPAPKKPIRLPLFSLGSGTISLDVLKNTTGFQIPESLKDMPSITGICWTRHF